MKKLYFDYAATTPVAPGVRMAMEPYLSERFGNPGSIHFFGQLATKAVGEAREKILKIIGAPAENFRGLIFTGSATEANNLALRGAIRKFYELNRDDKFLPVRAIISAIEHESVLATAEDLEAEGVELIVLPVDKRGVVDTAALEKSLNRRTAIVSIMSANNEIGTVEPIEEIGEIISEFRKNNNSSYPLFHTDSVQSFQYLNLNPEAVRIDLMSISGHKIYGPKGIGALYIGKHASSISPIITGGGQEFGLRSGTENVPGIVGFSTAVEEAAVLRDSERKRLNGLKIYFWQKLKSFFPEARLNAAEEKDFSAEPLSFLPHILNLCFPGLKAEEVIFRLDQAGVAISAGSACAARSISPSRVIRALDYGEKEALESVRISFGRETSKKEIGEAIKRISIALG